jgi:hypothetical protein
MILEGHRVGKRGGNGITMVIPNDALNDELGQWSMPMPINDRIDPRLICATKKHAAPSLRCDPPLKTGVERAEGTALRVTLMSLVALSPGEEEEAKICDFTRSSGFQLAASICGHCC